MDTLWRRRSEEESAEDDEEGMKLGRRQGGDGGVSKLEVIQDGGRKGSGEIRGPAIPSTPPLSIKSPSTKRKRRRRRTINRLPPPISSTMYTPIEAL